jgi:hypothetical protein
MSACFSSPCCGYEVIRSSSTVASVPGSTPNTRRDIGTSHDIDLEVSDDEILECVFERAYYTVNQLTSSISPWMMAPAEAKTNVAANYLYKVIESRSWDAVLELIQNDPSEAAVWITREENHSWKLLPIHAAIIFKAPEFIIEALLKAYPEGALEGDNRGMTPLHLAFRHAASDAILFSLLNSCPAAIGMKDKSGRTPLERHRTLFIPSNRDHSLTKKVSGIAKYVSIATLLEKEALELQLNNKFNARLKEKDDIISKLNANLEASRIEKREIVMRITSDFESKLQEKDAFIESLTEKLHAQLKAKDEVNSQISAELDAAQEREESSGKKNIAKPEFGFMEIGPIERSFYDDAGPERNKVRMHVSNSRNQRLMDNNKSTTENNDIDGISYSYFTHNHFKDLSHHKDSLNVVEEKIVTCVEEHTAVSDQRESSETTCADKYAEELKEEANGDRNREAHNCHSPDAVETEQVFNMNKQGLKKYVLIARLRERHNTNAVLARCYNSCRGLQHCTHDNLSLKNMENVEEKIIETESLIKEQNLTGSFRDHGSELPVFTNVQNHQVHSNCLEQKKPNESEDTQIESFDFVDMENMSVTSQLRSHQHDGKDIKVGIDEIKSLSTRMKIMEQLRVRYTVRPVFAEVQNRQRHCQMSTEGTTNSRTKKYSKTERCDRRCRRLSNNYSSCL